VDSSVPEKGDGRDQRGGRPVDDGGGDHVRIGGHRGAHGDVLPFKINTFSIRVWSDDDLVPLAGGIDRALNRGLFLGHKNPTSDRGRRWRRRAGENKMRGHILRRIHPQALRRAASRQRAAEMVEIPRTVDVRRHLRHASRIKPDRRRRDRSRRGRINGGVKVILGLPIHDDRLRSRDGHLPKAGAVT